MRKSHLIQFGLAVAIVFGAVTVIGQDHRAPPGAMTAPAAAPSQASSPQATPADEHDRAASGGQYSDAGQMQIGY